MVFQHRPFVGQTGHEIRVMRHFSGARPSNCVWQVRSNASDIGRSVEGTWEDAPDIEAHWHIDPPYQNPAGRVYQYNGVNRRELAKWCKRRRGFVQVCENDGAKWMRFEPFSIVHTHRARGYTAEAVFEIENF